MYDYELEKSLEERQKEELEMNLKRNAINRKFDRKMKIIHIINVVIFIFSCYLALQNIDRENWKMCLIYPGVALIVIFIILLITRRCPHCEESLNSGRYRQRYYDDYDDFALSNIFRYIVDSVMIDRCPHCGVILYPSESLTAIEERRKREKSGENPDL